MNRKQRRSEGKGQRNISTAGPQPPQPAVFSQAVRHHRAGQLPEAEKLYRQILATDPRHVDSLHLLGVVASQVGRYDDAVHLIGQAITLKDSEPAYHCHLGIALKNQGKLDAAIASYQRALSLSPDYADAHVNLGVALYAQGKLVEAVASYERALALKPDYVEAHLNLGAALNERGRPQEAIASYERAIHLRPDYVEAHYNRGNALKNMGRLREAVACYRRVVGLRPSHWEAYNNMGSALVVLDPDEAEASFRRALALRPEDATTLGNLASILSAKGNHGESLHFIKQCFRVGETPEAKSIFVSCVTRACLANDDDRELRTLIVRALEEAWGRPYELAPMAIELLKRDPDMIKAMASASEGWPSAAFAVLGSDPLLCALLQSTAVCDIELERFLTMARRALLERASRGAEPGDRGGTALRFFAALASQCFINEYVFACTADETIVAGQLREKIVRALDAGTEVSPLWMMAVASYFPLFTLANAGRLSETSWPAEMEATLKQQVYEPLEELEIHATIPRLTGVDDEVSIKVKDQYEENPYPRWIKAPRTIRAKDIEGHFRSTFPLAPIKPHEQRGPTDILIAGCGTGQHSIDTATRFSEAQVLAIDLSMSSLGYAERKTRELGLTSITYAQADLLKLPSLNRSFDIIEATGVLHHLASPWMGGKLLVSLLRPCGFLKLGLYSEVARRHVVEVRRFIERQGYPSTPVGIQQCREALMNAPANADLIRLLGTDFFSVSGCRDLLFHVQEHRMTLTEIDTFLQANDLTFLGFDIHPTVMRSYRERFPDDASATDLGKWQVFETENPQTFVGMYQLWVQKAG